jgi:hypothetical protein
MPSHIPSNATSMWLVVESPDGLFPHWGIFLHNPTCDNFGLFFDLVVNKNGNSTTHKSRLTFSRLFGKPSRKAELRCRKIESFSLARHFEKGGKAMDMQCLSTPRRLQEATREVLKDFKYSFLHENCQTFVTEVMKLLGAWDPHLVGAEWVEAVKNYASLTTRATRQPRDERPRFTSMAEADDARRYHASSSSTDVFDPSIAVLPRDDGVRGRRRTRMRTRETSDAQAVQQAERADRTLKKATRSEPTQRHVVRVHARMGRSMPGAWVE